MRVLGIETSCDETAAAIVDTNDYATVLVSQIVSSQIKLHQAYGGVVPELATREHLRNLPKIVTALLEQAHTPLSSIDAIAVTEGPGLASALLIGHSYARALGLACSKPVMGINHLEGHLFSPFSSHDTSVHFPFVGLISSGGHTILVHALGWDRYIKLGATVDDAAGEAFDKIARLLGLSYPGGPEIERIAAQGNPDAYALPRSFSERDNLNFSFSGLKTSVRYLWEKNPLGRDDPQWICDVAASCQKAIVDVLVRKAVQAVLLARVNILTCSGGVLCNALLRSELERECDEHNVHLLIADAAICTDNAAMIAATAAEKIAAGIEPVVSDDIHPNLDLFSPEPQGDFTRSMRRAIQLKNRGKPGAQPVAKKPSASRNR